MLMRSLVACAALVAAPAVLAQPVALSSGGIEFTVEGESCGPIVINGVPVNDTMIVSGAGLTSVTSAQSGFSGTLSTVTSGTGYAVQRISRGTFGGDAEIVITTAILGPYEDNGVPVADTAVVEQTFAMTNLDPADDEVNIFMQSFPSDLMFGSVDIRGFNALTKTPFIAAGGKFWAVTADDTNPEIDFGWEITDLSTQGLGPSQATFNALTNSVEPVGSQLLAVLRADGIGFGETVEFKFRHLFAVNGALTAAPDDFNFAPPEKPCPGDLDGDNDTDLGDFTILASDFGCSAP
ncbi:MAG: hypothetical protein AAFX05_02320 [Planctomycetota bacterium]